ncbi:MAG: radical SAM protein [Desulfohalobiaceae bacterium]
MDYQGRIIRPPSEADSILLQATVGCSHNKCTFCGAYKDKRFSFKPLDTVASDIAFAARHCQNQRRVFLCDGDALIMPQERLRRLLASIREHLPWVTRVATYAGAKSLKRKSRTELEELRSLGLSLVYMGLESGDQATLERVCKGSTVRDMIEQGCRARQAGLKLNITVLLGLAGKERSQEHALATGAALSEMDPDQVAALTLMLIPGTPLHDDAQAGSFLLPDTQGMLAELRTLLCHTDLSRGLFLSNHASNHLPLKVRLPRDRERALSLIDRARQGHVPLTPEGRRRL